MRRLADNIDRAIFVVVCLFVMAVLARSACGGVILHFEPVALTTPTADFTLGLYVSTTEPITGLDYGLSLIGARLDSRELSSDFPDEIDGTLANDLGASISDVSHPLDAGDYLVARYFFRVQNPANFCVVTPTQFPNTTGWVGPFPFDEHPFDSFQGSVVTFPEPAILAFIIPLFFRRDNQ